MVYVILPADRDEGTVGANDGIVRARWKLATLDSVDRGKEPFTGEINYTNVFKRIYEKGYEGMIGMEHGLSVPGREGLEKCFEAYRVADTWG